ncbi:methyltransferase family [Sporothrix brasiliensis 5110]|uniref:carnosine N-methyltransferase n=1 Tax=Sporothrix brasiliensis 5110 TaxID=1398154 RepID=A0A0C2INR2_9PEZI|nr:methyltransferase family [Sporothrix brasiliensis 5110]KIH88610.1 methyltransferase family [Sporothrix brasiliensis 5110]
MAETQPPSGGDNRWEVSDDAIQDPEEIRVLFCALDSFLYDHWKMLAAKPFSYLETLDRVDEAIESNAELAREIVRFGLESFRVGGSDDAHTQKAEAAPAAPGAEPKLPAHWSGVAKHQDVDKARSTLRQFLRDWTAAGADEREKSYGPVMRALAAERIRREEVAATAAEAAATANDGQGHNATGADSDHEDDWYYRGRLKVLVPGAGLGRLVFDLCLAGYEAEGNEISYHQLLASSYILNFTRKAGQHTIYPWVHSFSNHRVRENHLRSYAVPDVHPGQAIVDASMQQMQQPLQPGQHGIGTMSMCAADFLCLYSDAEHAEVYDAVACVFFLDTAPNLIRYIETIRHCLKPGGLLINIGPLLWHFENNAPGNHGRDDDGDGEHDATTSTGIADPGSFELSDDEVRALVEKLGFTVVTHETGVETPYIHDDQSLLQTVYKSSHWVARKN